MCSHADDVDAVATNELEKVCTSSSFAVHGEDHIHPAPCSAGAHAPAGKHASSTSAAFPFAVCHDLPVVSTVASGPASVEPGVTGTRPSRASLASPTSVSASITLASSVALSGVPSDESCAAIAASLAMSADPPPS